MSIDQFKSKFGYGIRPNLYTVTGTFGSGVALGNGEPFLIKSASVPPASLGTITIPFRGREIKRAGDRTFTDWSISVLCDEKMAVHKKFMEWSNKFISLKDDTRAAGNIVPYGEWTVTPQDNAGNPTEKFTLVGCWPIEVGTVDLGFDTTDSVAEFSVTLGYEYWTYASGSSE